MYRSIERTARSPRRRRSALASSVRADGVALRRPVRRRLAADPATAAPSVDVGALRRRRDAAGDRRGSAVADASRPRRSGPAWRRTRSLDSTGPMTSAVGLMLIVAGHARGWVVAEGGSQAIADALATDIERHGGRIETGRARDVSRRPAAERRGDVGRLAVDRRRHPGRSAPARVARSYRRFRHGPGAFKVDFAIEGDVPWTAPAAREAGTVHLGGRSRRGRRQREGCSSRGDARATVRARRPAVSRRPDPVGRQRPPVVDLRARAPRATPATRPRPSSLRSNDSPRASASGSSARRCAPRRRCRCTTRTTSAATSSAAHPR